jgi:DNA invertase Pin-like site-specific DNA recombinase
MIAKAVIYCRVSTTAGQSVEMQLRDLRQLGEQRGFEIVGEYCDEGVSGSCDSRPQLDRMLADAQRGKFQAILIWRLDRLGRSLQHLVRLFESFRSWNVALISFGEGLDFSTSMGKLFYQLSGAFAEFERDCIRERVRAGLRNAKAKGKRLGRPHIIVDTQKIAALRTQGRSWPQIAAQLGIGVGTAYRAHQQLSKNPKTATLSRIPTSLPAAVE